MLLAALHLAEWPMPALMGTHRERGAIDCLSTFQWGGGEWGTERAQAIGQAATQLLALETEPTVVWGGGDGGDHFSF